MHKLTARQPKRVLVVEDGHDAAELIRHTLETPVPPEGLGFGYEMECICGVWEVTVASTLAAACDVLRANHDLFDVVLLDLILPDGAREDAVHIVKEAAPDVPIIAHTGLQEEALVASLLSSNEVSDYIVKGTYSTPCALKQAICHAIDLFHVRRDGMHLCARIDETVNNIDLLSPAA